MSSKPRFPISGMRRGFLATEVSTPVAKGQDDVPATSLARRGIAISGAGRRLGISGMRRPVLETTVTTPDDTNEGLP
jgi:hypothetical protein